jgi:hypothetical protein
MQSMLASAKEKTLYVSLLTSPLTSTSIPAAKWAEALSCNAQHRTFKYSALGLRKPSGTSDTDHTEHMG